MIEAWYAIVSFMLITYAVLDGRNFGVGMLHWIVARTPEERRQVVAALGPLWPWHEVWLVAFGGTLVAVFPKLLASAFSGYYLALFLILWCLLLRAMALEVNGHIKDDLWQGFWDFVFVGSSFLLGILFGAAGGNMARGVPIDAQGNFSMAFFTNFGVRGNVGLLDWYTVSVAIFAMGILAAHGATYLSLKTDGLVHERAEFLARALWFVFPPMLFIITLETWFVRPDLISHGFTNPLTWIGTILVLGAGGSLYYGLWNKLEMQTFVSSTLIIAAMLATGAATLFPIMLYSTLDVANSMTAYTAASDSTNLIIASIWWPFAFIITIGYFYFISRYYLGKVSVELDDQNV